jgi:hypothetical protein
MKFKKVIALVLSISMLASLTACTKTDENEDPLMSEEKETLVSTIRNYETTIESLDTQLKEANNKLVGVYGEDTTKPAISQFESDDSGRYTLNSNEGVVEFPSSLSYPNSEQSSNVTTLDLGGYMKMKPTSSWEVILDGTCIKLYHGTYDIVGVVQVGKTSDTATMDDVHEALTTFFDSLPPANVSTSMIYCNGNQVGWDGVIESYVDEKDAMIRAGLLGFSGYNMSYVFEYEGEYDSAKAEVIYSLLQSIELNNNGIKLES